MRSLKFGGKLDFLMEERGLTSGDLSRISGVPEKTIERVRGGKNAPSAAHFVRIMRALRIENWEIIEPHDLEDSL